MNRGQRSVLSSLGPLARDVDSLALCMQALLSDHMFSLDPAVPPLPFNLQVYQSSKPLRIGYYENDGFLQPSPSMLRAIREVKGLLERAGHTLVPYSPPRVKYAMEQLCLKGMLADGGVTFLGHLKGSPVDRILTAQTSLYSLPSIVKTVLSTLFKPLFPRVAESIKCSKGVRNIPELWHHHVEVEDYMYATIAEWRRCDIDVLLCPMLGPAYNFFYCGKLLSALSCTFIYNLINFPAGVLPVTTVTADDEEQLRNYNGNFKDPFDKLFKQAVSGGDGLPVAVQCISLPWQDELCLRFMREVEQLVKQNRVIERTM